MGFFDRFRTPPQPPTTPRGSSGRGHAGGYLDYEELNDDLRGQSGLEVFDKMFRTDGDVRQIVLMVANPIVAGTWQVQPYGGDQATDEDQRVARALRWAFWEHLQPSWPQHLAEMLPVLIRSGFAPFEHVWASAEWSDTEGEKTNLLVPATFQLRLPRSIYRWHQDTKGRLTAIDQFVWPNATSPANSTSDTSSSRVGDFFSAAAGGQQAHYVTLPIESLLYYRVGGEGDNWEGVSMLRPAYKHWKIKDAIERIDAIAQEREAVGVPICYPPVGATPGQLDAIESILAGLRTNDQGYIVAPGPFAGDVKDSAPGWRIEILSNEGKGRDPGPSLEYHSHKITASFIAEFMRLGHESFGARATAQVQVNPFLMSVEALTSVIEEVINETVVARFCALNFPNLKGYPRLQMSIVDSTSLTQLADFVSKLVQVGALIPDGILEQFLRERADLPLADPEALKERETKTQIDPITGAEKKVKQTDTDLRMEILKGRGQGGEGQPAPAKPAGASGSKPAATNPRKAGFGLDTITLDCQNMRVAERVGRDLTPAEANVALDEIEDMVEGARARLEAALRPQIIGLARDATDGSIPSRWPDALEGALRVELGELYAFGRRTVAAEFARRRGQTETMTYARPDADEGDLDDIAELAAADILHRVAQAARRGELIHDEDAGEIQRMAEAAGLSAVRSMAQGWAMMAVNYGRLAEALSHGDEVIGARYHSILDAGRCAECAEADDGELRALDDPVRLRNLPPNRNCASTASGENRCRCFETFEVAGTTLDAELVPNDPTKTNWVEKRGGLPRYIADIAGDLITERGFTVERAIATAVNKVKEWAAGGDNVTAKTQAKAAAALAQWEAMKGSS